MDYRVEITEDALTNAIFNNSPLDAFFTGSKADARTVAQMMLTALQPDWADYYPINQPGCTVVPWAHLTEDTTIDPENVPF